MLNRIERIKATIDTVNDLRGTFTFPREEKRLKNILKKDNLPSEEEILDLDIKATVEEALQNVIDDMKPFGINAKENDWKYMQVSLIKRKQNFKDNEEIDEENEIDQDER